MWVDFTMCPEWYQASLANPYTDRVLRDSLRISSEVNRTGHEQGISGEMFRMTFAEFVEYKFLPEYVAPQRVAARLYFRSMLKYILRPARVEPRMIHPSKSSRQPRDISNWPYIGSLTLDEVSPEAIQHLVSVSLLYGYSPRTATHIRDVIRSIFSYAAVAGYYAGPNPALMVVTPAIVRKKANVLSLDDLRQVMRMMRYPERSIAIFALSTDMNVTEICGLQWKYVNLFSETRPLEGDSLPPRTIAIRNQSYRGVFGPVGPRRRRLLSASDLLHADLKELKSRERFVGSEDFVITSRTGSPVNPDNIALRRLKYIGDALEMPWLSWKVFHHTRSSLVRQFGRYLNRELERALAEKGA